jgi:type VI secretion system secreted protein VgrG
MPEQKTNTIGSSKLSTIEMIKRKELATSFLDEQIQFKNSDGVPLKDFRYSLCLDNGTWINGTTDRLGKTKRVVTAAPTSIVTAKLQPPSHPGVCSCAAGTEPDWIAIPLQGIKTNTVKVGESVVEVKTPKGLSRALTKREISILRVLFKDSIDYGKVRIINDVFSVILQRSGTAMAPDGNVYFHADNWMEDFADTRDSSMMQVFIHEIVHVWQHQLGYPVKSVRQGAPFMSYKYKFKGNGELLCDFNMEQQGQILSDYWAYVTWSGKPYFLTMKDDAQPFEMYHAPLKKFIANPRDPASLPHIHAFVEGRSKM